MKNIQIIKEKGNKVIFNPTGIDESLLFSYILDSNEYKDITIDLMDLEAIEQYQEYSSFVCGFIGRALDAQKRGKKVLILTVNNLPQEALELLNIVRCG